MRPYYFILLIAIPFAVDGQTNHYRQLTDSLTKQLVSAKEDTNKVRTLDLLSYNYSAIMPDEGIKYGEQALVLAKKLDWRSGILTSYADLGINYAAKSNQAKAIYYDKKALKLAEELGNKGTQAAVLANMSLVFLGQSDYLNALNYGYKALAFDEGYLDKRTGAIIRENLGTIYLEQKNYLKTMAYYLVALKLYEELGDREGIARSNCNVGIVHEARGEYDQAIQYHRRSLQTNAEMGNQNAMQINYANLGSVYLHMKNYQLALENQLQALKISEQLGIASSMAINFGNLGETYFALANDSSGAPEAHWRKERKTNLDRSIRYLEQAVLYCKKTGYSAPQIEFSQYLFEAYDLAGDYKKAFHAFKEHTQVKESVYSHQNQLELASMETKRELDLKDKRIIIKNKEIEIAKLQEKNKSNERIIYFSAILIILTVTGLVIKTFSRRNKVQRETLNDIAAIQSHELRGPLATILGLTQLFNQEAPNDPVNKKVIDSIAATGRDMDEIVRRIIDKSAAK